MTYKAYSSVPISEIRELATRFDASEIAQCQELVLQSKDNACYSAHDPEEVMNVLSKAGFVRDQVQQGFAMKEAIRELGKRIRMLKRR